MVPTLSVFCGACAFVKAKAHIRKSKLVESPDESVTIVVAVPDFAV